MANPTIRCQCRAISFPAPTPKPFEIYICHCTECRSQSASAFGISAIFPTTTRTQAESPFPPHLQSQVQLWTRPTEAGNTLECYFCKTCGVRILHRSILPDGKPKNTISVKGGCLEGLRLDGNEKHIFAKSAIVPVPDTAEQAEPED